MSGEGFLDGFCGETALFFGFCLDVLVVDKYWGRGGAEMGGVDV